jgi:hypothetical protein
MVPAAAPRATTVEDDGSSRPRPPSFPWFITASSSSPFIFFLFFSLSFLWSVGCFEATSSRIEDAEARQTLRRLKLRVSDRSAGEPMNVNFI